MGLLTDLDDRRVTRIWSFTGLAFEFRWPIGGRLVFVYLDENSISAVMAWPLDYDMEPTYENAQEIGRRWAKKHLHLLKDDGTLIDFEYRKKAMQRARGELQKKYPSPTGPRCAGCGKKDEGDFVEHPSNILLQTCMTCLITGKVK